MKFIMAVKRYFGKREGETLKSFAAEIKALTPVDRTEMAAELSEALGEDVQI